LSGVQTRRQILLGAGAVLVAGAGVALAEADDPRARRFLHRLGLADSPDHTVPDAHVALQSGSLESTHMPHPAAWTIASPKAPIRGVVYCLHGHGNDHREAFRDVHLPDVAAAAGLPFAVAAVDGGSDSYWHARADGSDPMTMFLDEFIPLVEQRLDVSPPRAVLGWSMGGYGALLAAERAPDLFAAVVASSPALWTSAGDTPAIAFDGESDYRRNDVFAGIEQLAPMVVRVDCGTDDPFCDAARTFASRLPHQNPGSFGEGFHDAAYWRSVAPAQIATIGKALLAVR
jgi:S-formylglutathione hydrolase FrmB